MKTLNEILKQKPIFLHNWSEKIDVISDFEDIYLTGKEYRAEIAPYANNKYWIEKKIKMDKAVEKWKSINILFASYGQDNYSGDAFILFEENGELFEVNGSHCSCYGLKGQFSPEATTLELLAYCLTNGSIGTNSYSDNEFANELKIFLGI